jgi:hypothetical protein
MIQSGGAPQGAPPASAPGLFAEHVAHAELGALTVLLDLKHDRYLAAPTALLAQISAGESGDEEARSLRLQLECTGVLASKSQHHWLAFLHACMWSQRVIAAKRLDFAMGGIRALRRRHGADRAPYNLIRAFDQMRPWYPHRMICLFDSLALMRFLCRCGAQGELVFGVRGMPFSAHCWVEHRGAPVNDEPGYCASFRQIVRV